MKKRKVKKSKSKLSVSLSSQVRPNSSGSAQHCDHSPCGRRLGSAAVSSEPFQGHKLGYCFPSRDFCDRSTSSEVDEHI